MLRVIWFLILLVPFPALAYGDMGKPKTGVCISPKDLHAGLMYMGYVRKIIAINENNLFISYYVNAEGAYVGVAETNDKACIFTQGDAIYVNDGQGI